MRAVREGAPDRPFNEGAVCWARTEGAPREAKINPSSCGTGKKGTSRGCRGRGHRVAHAVEEKV